MPRATLRALEIKTKGHKFRVLGTVLGAVAGLAAASVAAVGIEGGIFNDNNPAVAVTGWSVSRRPEPWADITSATRATGGAS